MTSRLPVNAKTLFTEKVFPQRIWQKECLQAACHGVYAGRQMKDKTGEKANEIRAIGNVLSTYMSALGKVGGKAGSRESKIRAGKRGAEVRWQRARQRKSVPVRTSETKNV